jgi:hypothetical protein
MLHRPRVLVALDPDSTRTAIALAVLDGLTYVVERVDAGGTGPAVSWSSVTGALVELRLAVALAGDVGEVVVVCETQFAAGPWSADVEALRRVRFHWEAACELLGVAFVHVDPGAWMSAFVPGARGAGAVKVAYRARARALVPRATNEDRAAAVGIAWWFASTLGCELRDGSNRGPLR